MTGSVLHPWVESLPLKKQSNLLSATRGPDHCFCRQLKRVIKFVRRATQIDADASTDFMSKKLVDDYKQLEREIEFSSFHFVCHLVEALETIAQFAPTELSKEAENYLEWITDTFHMAYANH